MPRTKRKPPTWREAVRQAFKTAFAVELREIYKRAYHAYGWSRPEWRPVNQNYKAQIRATLQRLVRDGEVEHCRVGVYRIISASEPTKVATKAATKVAAKPFTF